MEKINILALHGFLGRGSDWTDVQNKCADFNWICPNLFSDPDWDLQSFDRIAEKIIEKLNLNQSCVLLGYSLGGRIALQLLNKYPNMFRHIVLVSTNPGLQSDQEKAIRLKNDSLWIDKMNQMSWSDFLKQWNDQPVLQNSFEPERMESDFLKERLIQSLQNLSLGLQDDFRPIIQKYASRITWIYGEQDHKFAEISENLKKQIPELKTRSTKKGHRVLFDSPEVIAEVLKTTSV